MALWVFGPFSFKTKHGNTRVSLFAVAWLPIAVGGSWLGLDKGKSQGERQLESGGQKAKCNPPE